MPAGQELLRDGRVLLNVYDLHPQNDRFYSVGIGAYHTGVEIYGKEYAFGFHEMESSGIWSATPKQAVNVKFRESIDLGKTTMNEREVESIIDQLGSKWIGTSYNILTRNCNHFSEDFVQLLLGRSIPNFVNRLAYWSSYFSCFFPQNFGMDPPTPETTPRSRSHRSSASPSIVPPKKSMVISNGTIIKSASEPLDTDFITKRRELMLMAANKRANGSSGNLRTSNGVNASPDKL
eukprot:TRINITY_DN2617_c0_g1_i1.p1 TRINITY_DN2617_c0_g1~~TRINITY_DN2617_c0_g1_i1.p1  ORF type:complete len:235 (-),score=69.04 TRINITY_DN2617_c0_g1_i1:200-904(-)